MSFANDIALTSLLIHIAQYGTVSPYHGFHGLQHVPREWRVGTNMIMLYTLNAVYRQL